MLSAEAISSETLKAGSSGDIEEGLGGVGLGDTVTIYDFVEDVGEPFGEVGISLVGVTFGEAISEVTEPIVSDVVIGEEVVDDGIEVLGREYLGGRIGISVEIVEVSEGVASDAGSESFDREGSKDNSESAEREGSTIRVILKREIVERSVATSSWRTL